MSNSTSTSTPVDGHGSDGSGSSGHSSDDSESDGSGSSGHGSDDSGSDDSGSSGSGSDDSGSDDSGSDDSGSDDSGSDDSGSSEHGSDHYGPSEPASRPASRIEPAGMSLIAGQRSLGGDLLTTPSLRGGYKGLTAAAIGPRHDVYSSGTRSRGWGPVGVGVDD